MMSAAEQQLVGWPLPASDVDSTESIRSRVATFFRAGMSDERSSDMGLSILDGRLRISKYRLPVAGGETVNRADKAELRRRGREPLQNPPRVAVVVGV